MAKCPTLPQQKQVSPVRLGEGGLILYGAVKGESRLNLGGSFLARFFFSVGYRGVLERVLR